MILWIPDVDVKIPLYESSKMIKAQEIVDNENSGFLCRKFRGGHCDYIADHSSQGFNKIRGCKLFDLAIIQTDKDTQVYSCIMATTGTNTGKELVTFTGQKLSKIKWADLCCYCCNDLNGKSITMIFFKKSQYFNYKLYPQLDEGSENQNGSD